MTTTAASITRPPALLSVPDVADILGCQVDLVYKLVDRGELRVTRVGRLFRFTPEAVAAYIDACTAQAS